MKTTTIKWTDSMDSRLIFLWESGFELHMIPKAMGLPGPDTVRDRISALRARGMWPESSDAKRKEALRRQGPEACECGETFPTRRARGIHRRYAHGVNARGEPAPRPDNFSSEGPVTCSVCGVEVTSKRGLGGHMATRHRGGAPAAGEAGAGQVQAVEEPPAEHPRPVLLSIPGGAPPAGHHACDTCGATFATSDELAKHRAAVEEALGPATAAAEAAQAAGVEVTAFAAFKIDHRPEATVVAIEFTALGKDSFVGAWLALKSLGPDSEYDVEIRATRRVKVDA